MSANIGARPAFALPAVPQWARLHVLRARIEGGYLIAAASPVALLGLLNMALGLTDMVMVGRFDPQGLAAIVVMGDLHSIVFNFTAGFAGLVAPYVANAIGARLPWQVCTIVQRVVVLVSALALTRHGADLERRDDPRGSGRPARPAADHARLRALHGRRLCVHGAVRLQPARAQRRRAVERRHRRHRACAAAQRACQPRLHGWRVRLARVGRRRRRAGLARRGSGHGLAQSRRSCSCRRPSTDTARR